MTSVFENVRSFIEREGGSHAFDHVLRVVSNCLRIIEGEEIEVRTDLVLYMALLHDLDREERVYSKREFAQYMDLGTKKAEMILRKSGLCEKDIGIVVDGIRTHSFDSQTKPQTKEAEILWDADKLDAIGAVGIARTFLNAGAGRSTLERIIEKGSQNLKKLCFYTTTGKKLAEDRKKYVLEFSDRLKDEIDTNKDEMLRVLQSL